MIETVFAELKKLKYRLAIVPDIVYESRSLLVLLLLLYVVFMLKSYILIIVPLLKIVFQTFHIGHPLLLLGDLDELFLVIVLNRTSGFHIF